MKSYNELRKNLTKILWSFENRAPDQFFQRFEPNWKNAESRNAKKTFKQICGFRPRSRWRPHFDQFSLVHRYNDTHISGKISWIFEQQFLVKLLTDTERQMPGKTELIGRGNYTTAFNQTVCWNRCRMVDAGACWGNSVICQGLKSEVLHHNSEEFMHWQKW